MAKQIETAFYALEETGVDIDECFTKVAEQFAISIDDVADALNEAAFA